MTSSAAHDLPSLSVLLAELSTMQSVLEDQKGAEGLLTQQKELICMLNLVRKAQLQTALNEYYCDECRPCTSTTPEEEEEATTTDAGTEG